MPTDKELMQQALDALVTAELDGNCEYGVTDSLRARLAQPEPEPEKSQDKPCVEDDGCPTEKAVLQRFWREHQAQPEREWVGLTDEERLEILGVGGEAAVLYVTEAKLREKNA